MWRPGGCCGYGGAPSWARKHTPRQRQWSTPAASEGSSRRWMPLVLAASCALCRCCASSMAAAQAHAASSSARQRPSGSLRCAGRRLHASNKPRRARRTSGVVTRTAASNAAPITNETGASQNRSQNEFIPHVSSPRSASSAACDSQKPTLWPPARNGLNAEAQWSGMHATTTSAAMPAFTRVRAVRGVSRGAIPRRAVRRAPQRAGRAELAMNKQRAFKCGRSPAWRLGAKHAQF